MQQNVQCISVQAQLSSIKNVMVILWLLINITIYGFYNDKSPMIFICLGFICAVQILLNY